MIKWIANFWYFVKRAGINDSNNVHTTINEYMSEWAVNNKCCRVSNQVSMTIFECEEEDLIMIRLTHPEVFKSFL